MVNGFLGPSCSLDVIKEVLMLLSPVCLRRPYLLNIETEQDKLNTGPYMNAQVFLNLSNNLGKSEKIRALKRILWFFATSLINPITLEHEC